MKPIRIKIKPQPIGKTTDGKTDSYEIPYDDYDGNRHDRYGRKLFFTLEATEYSRRLAEKYGAGKAVEENGVYIWERRVQRRLSLKQLAKLARRCKTKLQMSFTVRGDQLEECVRIQQIQRERHKLRNGKFARFPDEYPDTPRRRRDWAKQLKPHARRHAMEWPAASEYEWGFKSRLADKIKKDWQYEWSNVDYSLGLIHSRTKKLIKHSRAAASYTTFSTTLTFDLLQEEAVWIGGLLTIRRKEHARKKNYPCVWLVKVKNGPGLRLKRGWILSGNYHIVADSLEQAERRRHLEMTKHLREAKLKRERDRLRQITERQRTERQKLESIGNYTPPRGWANRRMSLRMGNCQTGTDNWIENKLIPYYKKLGINVGNLAGVAVRISTVLAIERSDYTLRLARQREPVYQYNEHGVLDQNEH